MAPKKEQKETVGQSLDKLEKIVEWFDDQESVRVEEGLAKVREGAALIKELRGHLKEVENEFQELQKDLTPDEEA
jgi:exodeoxyribonuclease VII small subunit